jgi:hypothetical protein
VHALKFVQSACSSRLVRVCGHQHCVLTVSVVGHGRPVTRMQRLSCTLVPHYQCHVVWPALLADRGPRAAAAAAAAPRVAPSLRTIVVDILWCWFHLDVMSVGFGRLRAGCSLGPLALTRATCFGAVAVSRVGAVPCATNHHLAPPCLPRQ